MSQDKSVLAVVAEALAWGIRPNTVILPARWAAENLVVADGPHTGQRWSAELTPYVVEILNNLVVDGPHNRVSVRKSAQTGLTEAGIAWIGSIMDKTPAKALVVFPTIRSAQDFNREKLTPTIDATDVLRVKLSNRSRFKKASTALNKQYPGGSLTLTGANSASDLRSKTVRYAFCDEIDEWPLDLDGQGDPMEMVNARLTAFHATGDYMLFEVSTPTIKGLSRIDNAFLEGDQRYWHVPCCHCGEYQRLVFGGKDKPFGLKFAREWPHEAYYACCHCGGVIQHHQKSEIVKAGKWVALAPGGGKHPSYHIDALVSLLTTWDKIVEEFLKSKDDPNKLRAFVNLKLGEAWEERGDAPEWNKLYARRSGYRKGLIPDGGVVLTGAADIQSDGIYYEIVAWGSGERSWSIDVGFLPGDTADAKSKPWHELERIFLSSWSNINGGSQIIDLAGVDSGYNTGAVYAFVKRNGKFLALKGVAGWGRPPLGTALSQDVTWNGRKQRRGLKVWNVGTWTLKSKFYANLRKIGIPDGLDEDPPGYCYFSEFHDDIYFRQITSEYLKSNTKKGHIQHEWYAKGPNHYLDCRIYNMAVASHPYLRLPDLSDNEWKKLANERNINEDPQLNLEALSLSILPQDEKETPSSNYINTSPPYIPRNKNWLSPRR